MDYKEKIGILYKNILRKDLTELVRKYLEALKWISQHATWAAKISQEKVDFAACEIAFQLWCSCLPMAITSSFQLQFAHRLKRWILDFPSFEMVYSM